MGKVKAPIIKVTVDGRVFRQEPFFPTLINFFYGKNGTGKSTISMALKNGTGLEWKPGVNGADYEMLVYNEDYIKENVASYGNISGVFTLSKKNNEVQAQIDEKKKLLEPIVAAIPAAEKERDSASTELGEIENKLTEEVWSLTDKLRQKSRFPELQIKFRTDKKKFTGEIKGKTQADHSEEEIQRIYDRACDKEAREYDEYNTVTALSIPDSPLLGKQIINSGSTPFAEFVKTLKNVAWIQQGHEEYHKKADGKCPYCMRDLPATFEDDLASCFDKQYQDDVEALTAFYDQYKKAVNNICGVLLKNKKNEFKAEHMSAYQDKIDLLTEKAKKNGDLIESKINDPSKEVALEDLGGILTEINTLIGQINVQIRENNQIYKDRNGQKKRCEEMLWERMAFLCRAELAAYHTSFDAITKKRIDAENKIKQLRKDEGILRDEIAALSKNTANTDDAMHNMNKLIRDSGFQGFMLQKRPGADYAYQLVRNGRENETAQDLSEGERHFIAFLYFYHEVIGSKSDDGKKRDKIVVIDDPVSSMDSGTLCVVASLVRHIIGICYNNYGTENMDGAADNYVRQVFCLTHNPYFFREITYNRIRDYECASFYELKKEDGNLSRIECSETVSSVEQDAANISPVKNYYDSLWYEYQNAKNNFTLLNVTRQILEYYFLQTCGYDGPAMRAQLLDKLSEGSVDGDGIFNQSEHDLADAMLALLDTEHWGIQDAISFDCEAVAQERFRDMFRKVFEYMHQDQHYAMMVGKSK